MNSGGTRTNREKTGEMEENVPAGVPPWRVPVVAPLRLAIMFQIRVATAAKNRGPMHPISSSNSIGGKCLWVANWRRDDNVARCQNCTRAGMS